MLKDQIEVAKRSVNTDTVQITVGEVATMYKDQELDIIPDFQRLFRWSIDKKSSFIESILIGIPIPSVFVYENEDGTWELIDGLQRISTILEFMGVLKDPDTGVAKRSVLASTKYLKALGGIAWTAEGHDEKPLGRPFQLFFRRHRIDFQILKHPSDPSTKYDLFSASIVVGRTPTSRKFVPALWCSRTLLSQKDCEFSRLRMISKRSSE